MQVSFEGIFLWDRLSRAPGLLGIMPNALAGDPALGIPPHTPCIIVDPDEVDDADWDEAPIPTTLRGIPLVRYELAGDEISFDPAPNGGSRQFALLGLPPCGAGKILNPALTGAVLPPDLVAGRITLPESASIRDIRNDFEALITILQLADGTRLSSIRPDGSVRSLEFTNGAHVIVANADLASALGDPETTLLDDEHSHLYCPMFIESAESPLFALRGDLSGGLLFTVDVGNVIRLPESVRALRQLRTWDQQNLGKQLLLGTGCSNSQYP